MGRSVVATLNSQELAQIQDGIKQISNTGKNPATDGFRLVAGIICADVTSARPGLPVSYELFPGASARFAEVCNVFFRRMGR